MKLNSSRRRIALLLGAVATTGALFAPSAVASPAVPILNCAVLGGSGTVTLSPTGVAKGHCSFKAFPDLGLGIPAHVSRAVHVSCDDLADALTARGVLNVTSEPTGEVVLTPSGNANVNCRDVVLGGGTSR